MIWTNPITTQGTTHRLWWFDLLTNGAASPVPRYDKRQLRFQPNTVEN
jgi:hypothetical protein